MKCLFDQIVKPLLRLLLLVCLLCMETAAYGAITVIPEPNTPPQVLTIVEKVVAAFNGIVEQRMKVTLSKDIKIYVCPNLDSYRRVLREEFGYSPAEAASHSEITGGVARDERNLIALNFGEVIFDQESNAYYVTAHELAHQLQFQLASGKEERGLYWLAEGSADYLAAYIAEDIGYLKVADWKIEQYYGVRHTKNIVSPSELSDVTHYGWEKLMKSDRHPYPVAGLMTCFLMKVAPKTGLTAIAEYYQRLAMLETAETNFEQSFGMGYPDFEEKVRGWFEKLYIPSQQIKFDSKGNFDAIGGLDEGFNRSQGLFKEHFGAVIRSEQEILLAPDRRSYLKMLQNEMRLGRQAEPISKTNSWWLNGKKALIFLDELPDCASKVYHGSLIAVRRFQNQQVTPELLVKFMWLREGMADVIAAMVTEDAEAAVGGSFRKLWLKNLQGSKIKSELTLTELLSPEGWDQAVAQYGITAVRAYTACAVSELMARQGIHRLGEWLATTKDTQDPKSAFEKVFGETVDEYSEEFKENLAKQLA